MVESSCNCRCRSETFANEYSPLGLKIYLETTGEEPALPQECPATVKTRPLLSTCCYCTPNLSRTGFHPPGCAEINPNVIFSGSLYSFISCWGWKNCKNTKFPEIKTGLLCSPSAKMTKYDTNYMQGEEKNVEREKLFYFALSLQRLLSTAFLSSCVLCLPHHSHDAQWGPRHSGKVNLLMSLVLCILSAHFVGPNRCHWVSKYRCFDYFRRFSYLNRGHINIHDCKHILAEKP